MLWHRGLTFNVTYLIDVGVLQIYLRLYDHPLSESDELSDVDQGT